MKRFTWDAAQEAHLATARGFLAFGIPAGTVRRWASEKRIVAHGTAPGGAHLYDIDEVAKVADTVNHTPNHEATCKTGEHVEHLPTDSTPMSRIVPIQHWVTHCRWPGCQCEPVEIQIPLCERHYAYIGQRYIDEESVFGTAYQKYMQPIRQAETAKQAERRAKQDAERQAKLKAQSVVYYVRIGDHVKIGYTVNLTRRLSSLRVDRQDVLATEPGGRDLEIQRHAEFADERVGRRENFNPSRRLLAHIEAIRKRHGDPNITDFPRVG